jgi:hypothetical protein
MSRSSYDLSVALRVYPKPSASRPPVFAEDKFKLVEFCFKSFKESLRGLRVKLWVLLNGCPPEYEAMFRKWWPEKDLVFVHYDGVPPGTTIHEQSRLLMEQTDAEIVYFAEDDYFYLPDQFHLAVDFIRQNPDADFVSPYEHPDILTTGLHNVRRESREFGGKTWSSCVATTHTFLARRSALLDARKVFLTFNGRTNPDLAMWMALTKKQVFNPVKFVSWLVPHKFWAGSVLLAWYFFWRQILFGRRFVLWVPRPAIATHMVAGMEAPGIDWPEKFQRQLAGVSPEASKP